MRAVVVPGNHDGVHLGHRALLRRAREFADSSNVVAYTYEPHPMAVLHPELAPRRLTSAPRRTELLLQAGATQVVVEAFDHVYSQLTPEDFVKNVLVDRLQTKTIVVGPDYRFGCNRKGDLDELRALGQRHGFSVEIFADPVTVGGTRVSSTAARQAVSSGALADAAQLLGRYHDVDGLVIRGDQRGRTIGFPTANLQTGDELLPPEGIYAVTVVIDGVPRAGAASLGPRPTFNASDSFEVFVLDFSGDLYGKSLRVGWIERLRGVEKYHSVEALVRQMHVDVAKAAEAFENADREFLRWI